MRKKSAFDPLRERERVSYLTHKYCNRMALVLTHSYSYPRIKPYAISQSQSNFTGTVSLSLRYSTRLYGFTTISFQTKVGNNHLATTVKRAHPHTYTHTPTHTHIHTHTHTQNCLHSSPAPQPIATPAHIQLFVSFSQKHYSQPPPHNGHISVLSRTHSKK
jgi:hypothetical protein